MSRVLRLLLAVGMVAGLLAVPSVASATKPDPDHRVTICHRTNSVSHPYVKITVDEASINGTGGQGDHSLQHLGPVFDFTADPDVAYPTPRNGNQWGDIIPTFYENGAPGTWDGLNWPDGQAIFEAGCKIPNEPETTHHVLTKNIPNVLQGDEEISITFDLYVIVGGVEEFVEECTLTFGAGDTQKVCTFNNLTPGFSYVIYESDTGGFDEVDPYYFTAGANEANSTSNEITNTFEPATAEACKTTTVINGYGFDATKVNFTFNLLEDGVEVSEVVIAGGGAPTCKTFDYALKDNHTYTVTEDAVAGWEMGSVSCTVHGTAATEFTPQYPGDKDASFSCSATNVKRFDAPLTPGYWKTHLAPISSTCSSSKGCSANGPWTVTYLPQSLGGYTVDTTAKVTAVFNKMNCSNTGTQSAQNQNAIGCLAGHLLATKLNIANGADATCIGLVVADADTFLTGIPYTGPTGTYTGIGTAKRNTAIALKNKLDKFNNALGCP